MNDVIAFLRICSSDNHTRYCGYVGVKDDSKFHILHKVI